MKPQPIIDTTMLWTEVEQAAWRPPERLTVSEWADKKRVLLPKTSSEPGPWRTIRTPYLKEPMDAFSDPEIETIVLEFATQVGKTECMYNCLGYVVDQDPASVLLVMPTLDLAKYTSRNRIQPMINASDDLRDLKPANTDLFTTMEMTFPGMVLSLAGANSPASLATRPCRYVFFDEVNKYPKISRSDEADPISLARERQKNFWNRKTIIVSSPTVETGQITIERNMCDVQYVYHVPCPHCGHLHKLKLENIKKPDDLDSDSPTYLQEVRESAYYQCPECHESILSIHKTAMLAAGVWHPIAAHIPTVIRSKAYLLSSLYSPWLTWGDILSMFLASKNDPEKLRNFKNSWLAQTWKDIVVSKKGSEILAHKTDLPPLIVSPDAVALTMGADPQKKGIYFVIRAWAADYTSWLIRYGYLLSWDHLYQIIFEDRYTIQGTDNYMQIWRAAIDTGGTIDEETGLTSTEEVYSWLREHSQGVAFGIKGTSWKMVNKIKQTIIDRMPGKQGVSIPGGIIIYILDTDKFKESIHYRLQQPLDKPQAFFLHSETDEQYARHITAEEKVRDRKGNMTWQKVRKRNDYLDCEVYAAACADPEWLGGIQVIGTQIQQSQQNAAHTQQQDIRENRPKWVDPHKNWMQGG